MKSEHKMMMPWLTPNQVVELTGCKQYQKQVEALRQMGIDYKIRPDGSLVVMPDDLVVSKPKEVRFSING
jgi:hypothetical protein